MRTICLFELLTNDKDTFVYLVRFNSYHFIRDVTVLLIIILQHVVGCRLVATLALDLGCARGSLTEYFYSRSFFFPG